MKRSLGKTDFSVLCIGDTSWENLQFQVEELARAVISLRSNFPEDLIISVFDSLSNSSIQGSMNQSCVESKHVNIGEDTKRSVNKVEMDVSTHLKTNIKKPPVVGQSVSKGELDAMMWKGLTDEGLVNWRCSTCPFNNRDKTKTRKHVSTHLKTKHKVEMDEEEDIRHFK